MKDAERLTGDKQLYSIHEAINRNRPNIVGPLSDVQFFVFPQALSEKIFGKLLDYRRAVDKVGVMLGENAGFTQSESKYFGSVFSEVIKTNYIVSLANRLSTRYPLLNVGERAKRIEKVLTNPFGTKANSAGLDREDHKEEELEVSDDEETKANKEDPETINKEVQWIVENLFGVRSMESLREWRAILNNAGESLGNIFSEPHLNLSQAKRTMDFYVRQIKTLRIPESESADGF